MSREIEEWEYEIRNETPILPSNRGNKQEYLNMMGEEGWQLVCWEASSPVLAYAIFKRPKKDSY